MLVLTALLFISTTTSYYLPGVAPHDYKAGDSVGLHVNALSAVKSFLPYDYYYPKFHFCQPKDGPKYQPESLGAILLGDRLFNSPFVLKAQQNTSCVPLCETTIPKDDVPFVMDRIDENYDMNWLVDGLPAAQIMTYGNESFFYGVGFDLGQTITTQGGLFRSLNNHYDIYVHYHPKDNERIRVVGVIVEPKSMSSKSQEAKCAYNSATPGFVLNDAQDNKVIYTYSVKWIKDDISWGTRWDNYLHVYDVNIHWFSIVNSILIVIVLFSMVTMILLRALHKDIARYNAVGEDEELDGSSSEDIGWKLVHADVFRPPRFRLLLSVFVGSGIQIIIMSFVTLFIAILGFASPSIRGALESLVLIVYILTAFVAGYVSARIYKTWRGEHWKANVITTALLVPGFCFTVLVSLNFFLIAAQSSAAVPFGTLVALMTLWFLISVPLCFVGAYLGLKAEPFSIPCKTNQIPRQIPSQPFYLNKWNASLLGGILPFGAIFIELFFIISSMWSHRIYYMFGFLFIVFCILIMTCALVSVILCYFHLCSEDYEWGWRAFFTSGSSGFYVFLYIFFSKLPALTNVSSTILYFGWTLLFSFLFTLLTGSVGYLAVFYFVRKIFASIKVD